MKHLFLILSIALCAALQSFAGAPISQSTAPLPGESTYAYCHRLGLSGLPDWAGHSEKAMAVNSDPTVRLYRRGVFVGYGQLKPGQRKLDSID